MAQLSFDNRRYSLNLKPSRDLVYLQSGFGLHRLGLRFALSAIGDYPKGVLHQLTAEVWLRDLPGVSGWLGTARADRPEPGRDFETTLTMVLPISEDQIRRLEKGRASRDLQISLDFHALALGGELGWPAAEAQETVTIPHAEWSKALNQVALGAYVDVLVPITLVEGRATAARRIREAKQAHANGQYEHAVTLSRAALDAVRDACQTKAMYSRATQRQKADDRDQPERWAVLIQAAYQLFSGAPHDDVGSTENFVWTQADAIAAVAVAAGLLARLEDVQ
jgi:hypothetical protein